MAAEKRGDAPATPEMNYQRLWESLQEAIQAERAENPDGCIGLKDLLATMKVAETTEAAVSGREMVAWMSTL